MVELSTSVECRGDVSLVELVVANDAPIARRVRIANRLDGPVWPPRTGGVPEEGWDDGGFEGVLGPDERLGLGYASPAAPIDPPAEVAWCERAADPKPDEGENGRGWKAIRHASPDGVLRALGDPRPPRDAVGGPDVEPSDPEPDPEPDSVDEWLADVEVRIERGKALRDATTLLEAARTVEHEGSLPAAEGLVEQLETDAETLRRVERRTAALAELAEETADDVPLAAFRRLS